MAIWSGCLPRLIMLDLDGTLYIGNQPIAGAVEAIAQLRKQGFELRFLTNTTTKSQVDLIAHMRAIGFVIQDHELISAPIAATLELERLQVVMGRPLRIWPVVANAIRSDFDAFVVDENNPDFIVLGDIGDAWSLSLINRLFNALHSGAELISLHKNRFWQTADGLKADIGFFVAGFEYVCSKTARVMGKPNPDFFHLILDSLGVTVDMALMVGDDIDTDIGGAQLIGLAGCLVKTGKFRQAYFEQSGVVPSLTVNSIADLPNLLSQ